MKIHGTIDSLDKVLTAAIAARGHLSADRRAAVDAEVDTLILLDIHSDEGSILKPMRLREQLAFLGSSLEFAFQRPTAAEEAAYAQMESEATAGIADLENFRKP